MYKKLTITLEADIYNGLHKIVGRGNISSFLANLARPYVMKKQLYNAYKEMANDKERENEADEWSETLINDSL